MKRGFTSGRGRGGGRDSDLGVGRGEGGGRDSDLGVGRGREEVEGEVE